MNFLKNLFKCDELASHFSSFLLQNLDKQINSFHIQITFTRIPPKKFHPKKFSLRNPPKKFLPKKSSQKILPKKSSSSADESSPIKKQQKTENRKKRKRPHLGFSAPTGPETFHSPAKRKNVSK